MKNITISFYLFLTLILTNCTKDDNPPLEEQPIEQHTNPVTPPCVITTEIEEVDSLQFIKYCVGKQEFGTATAYRENEIWEGSLAVTYRPRGRDQIIYSVKTYDCTPSLTVNREGLYIITSSQPDSCIILSNSDSLITDRGYAEFNFESFDSIQAELELVEEEDNFLEITELDTINNRISGKFMLTVTYKDTTTLFAQMYRPHTFRFVNGEFSGELLR